MVEVVKTKLINIKIDELIKYFSEIEIKEFESFDLLHEFLEFHLIKMSDMGLQHEFKLSRTELIVASCTKMDIDKTNKLIQISFSSVKSSIKYHFSKTQILFSMEEHMINLATLLKVLYVELNI